MAKITSMVVKVTMFYGAKTTMMLFMVDGVMISFPDMAAMTTCMGMKVTINYTDMPVMIYSMEAKVLTISGGMQATTLILVALGMTTIIFMP